MNHVRYEISSVGNQTMKTSLKNALDKIEGVQKVGVDLVRNFIEIEFNEPARESEIQSCVKKTGFSIDNFAK